MNPYITVLMLVFNEEKFLDICLSNVIGYANKIVIVEGAVHFFWKYAHENGSSKDSTLKILKKWQENYPDKIEIIQGKWKEKIDMQQAGLRYVPSGTEYLHIVDADEMMSIEALICLREVLRNQKPDVVRLGMTHWAEGGKKLGGGKFNLPIHRVFRWTEGFKFKEKTMNVPDPSLYKTPKEIVIQNAVQHYGHIDPERSRIKAEYYKAREESWNKA